MGGRHHYVDAKKNESKEINAQCSASSRNILQFNVDARKASTEIQFEKTQRGSSRLRTVAVGFVLSYRPSDPPSDEKNSFGLFESRTFKLRRGNRGFGRCAPSASVPAPQPKSSELKKSSGVFFRPLEFPQALYLQYKLVHVIIRDLL